VGSVVGDGGTGVSVGSGAAVGVLAGSGDPVRVDVVAPPAGVGVAVAAVIMNGGASVGVRVGDGGSDGDGTGGSDGGSDGEGEGEGALVGDGCSVGVATVGMYAGVGAESRGAAVGPPLGPRPVRTRRTVRAASTKRARALRAIAVFTLSEIFLDYACRGVWNVAAG